MEEKNIKRKEWVKTATIIFLIVMLVLTFFSHTIMNYSLPEVATAMIEPGSITAKIRGTGNLTSEEPYKVTIQETELAEARWFHRHELTEESTMSLSFTLIDTFRRGEYVDWLK